MKFAGSLVALITPFRPGASGDEAGEVDEERLRALVEYQIRNGTSGLVPCGTTGESVTLSEEEHERVVRIVVETANGRVPVIAGAGSNSTAHAIHLSKAAKRAGADALLIVTPYYNKPTQSGMYLHFEAIAKAVDLPIVVYNIPGRTSINLFPETLARLSKIDNIVGVKESTGVMDQVSQTVALCGPDFSVLSGDDSLTLPIMSLGGSGVISVIANVAPRATCELVAAMAAGDAAKARELHYRLFDLCRTMFIETNPIPVKTAAGILGLCSPAMRLPMSPMTEANLPKFKAVIEGSDVFQRA